MISEQFLDVISILGKKHPSDKLLQFIMDQGVFFKETLTGIENEYYYEFFDSGITLIFESDVVTQVSVYFNDEENYKPCQKCLFKNLKNKEINYDCILDRLGTPYSYGGGDISMLLGYTEKWLKYDFEEYYINIQFSKDNILSKIHFIYKN